jgi:hypothetical protein
MMASVDGRIVVDGWPVSDEGRREYERVHAGYDADGWICGRITMEPFDGGVRPEAEVAREHGGGAPREDFRALRLQAADDADSEPVPVTCRPPANEFAAGTSQSPPARTRRPDGVRRPKRLPVRHPCLQDQSLEEHNPWFHSRDIGLRRREGVEGRGGACHVEDRNGRHRRIVIPRERRQASSPRSSLCARPRNLPSEPPGRLCARISRPQSAKADFASFQRRIHSLLAATALNRPADPPTTSSAAPRNT